MFEQASKQDSSMASASDVFLHKSTSQRTVTWNCKPTLLLVMVFVIATERKYELLIFFEEDSK